MNTDVKAKLKDFALASLTLSLWWVLMYWMFCVAFSKA